MNRKFIGVNKTAPCWHHGRTLLRGLLSCYFYADPFKSVALPEVIEEYLNYGVAKCCAFNRRGTLLASEMHQQWIAAAAKQDGWLTKHLVCVQLELKVAIL